MAKTVYHMIEKNFLSKTVLAILLFSNKVTFQFDISIAIAIKKILEAEHTTLLSTVISEIDSSQERVSGLT